MYTRMPVDLDRTRVGVRNPGMLARSVRYGTTLNMFFERPNVGEDVDDKDPVSKPSEGVSGSP